MNAPTPDARAHRHLIVSDMHLTEVVEPVRGWMYYKGEAWVIDDGFDAMVARALDELPEGARFSLVLNGDIFDFDLVTTIPDAPPWKVTGAERRYGLHPTPAKSYWKRERMLAAHPQFVATLGRVVAAGHEVVYVLGNHDRELAFVEVQRRLVAAVLEAAGPGCDPERAVRFEPWCHHIPGALWIEHGNQYDDWSAFHDLVQPTASDAPEAPVELPMGNLSCRYLINRIGTFNPHDEDFIRSGPAYVWHWLKYYAFTRHSLIGSWLLGSFLIMFAMLRRDHPKAAVVAARRARMRAEGARHGLSAAQVDALLARQSRPVAEQPLRLARELWLDRVGLIALMVGGTLALALTPVPLWVKLMVPLSAFPLTWLLWNQVFSGSIFDYLKRLPAVGRHVAEVTGCAVVVMGHTHHGGLTPLDRDRVLANTGTWAPVGAGLDGGALTPGKQNFVVVDVAPGRTPEVRVGSWLAPRPSACVVEAAVPATDPAPALAQQPLSA